MTVRTVAAGDNTNKEMMAVCLALAMVTMTFTHISAPHGVDTVDGRVLGEDTPVRIRSLDYYTIYIGKTYTSEDVKG